jgi:leucyl/phenylalanyl-tRNA--protein transferase
MPVFRLTRQPLFPAPHLAEPDGLLAVGGDLSSERLLLAYSMGIFPWYNQGDPLLWWSPDPRCILEPGSVKISRSLSKVLRRGDFEITFDRAFREIMTACAVLRRNQEGTWITEEMLEAYCRLHELGYAHSVEVRQGGELVGGLYGICLGRCFFGESMFHRVTNASKVALVALAEHARKQEFELIDCQQSTAHLLSLGAVEIPRLEFLARLRRGRVFPSICPPQGNFGQKESWGLKEGNQE